MAWSSMTHLLLSPTELMLFQLHTFHCSLSKLYITASHLWYLHFLFPPIHLFPRYPQGCPFPPWTSWHKLSPSLGDLILQSFLKLQISSLPAPFYTLIIALALNTICKPHTNTHTHTKLLFVLSASALRLWAHLGRNFCLVAWWKPQHLVQSLYTTDMQSYGRTW